MFLLGGQEAISEIGQQPEGWLSLRLAGELGNHLKRKVEVAVGVTKVGHALQQKLLFERFYAAQRPDAK